MTSRATERPPWPRFSLVPTVCPPAAPAVARQALGAHRIPQQGVGADYVAMRVAEFLDAHTDLLAFGRSGLSGRVCLDIETLKVVHVPVPQFAQVNPVNSSLPAFNACVEAAIAQFPYYTHETFEELCASAVESLRSRLMAIDPETGAHNGLWETFLDDVANGDYAQEEFEPLDLADR